MDENYYDDGGSDPMPDKPAEESPEKDSSKTFLVNSEICPGMKAGDEMVVKIERVMDGEYEVSYAPEKAHDESMEPEPSMMGGGGESDGMFE